MSATYFEIPLDVRALFTRARPPLRVTIKSHTYRSTVAVYRGPYFLLSTRPTGRRPASPQGT
ncbi:MAG: hypothetical protein ACR2I4_06355 [Actinomycetota bacterium]